MVATAYIVEHVFFGLILLALAFFWCWNFYREWKNPSPSEFVYYIDRLAAILLIIYLGHVFDWRGVYGFIDAPSLYFIHGLVEVILFASFIYFLYAFLSAIFMNEDFDLSYYTDDRSQALWRIKVFFIVLASTCTAGFVARSVLLFYFYHTGQAQRLSIYEGSWLFYLAIHFLILGIVFIVVTIRLRICLMAQLSPNASLFNEPGYNDLDAVLWAAICKLTIMSILILFLTLCLVATQAYHGFVLVDKPSALKMSKPDKYDFWGGMLGWNVELFLFLMLWIAWEENALDNRGVFNFSFYRRPAPLPPGVQPSYRYDPYYGGYGYGYGPVPAGGGPYGPRSSQASQFAGPGRTLGTSSVNGPSVAAPPKKLTEKEQREQAEQQEAFRAKAAAEVIEARNRRNYKNLGVKSDQEAQPLLDTHPPTTDKPGIRDDGL